MRSAHGFDQVVESHARRRLGRIAYSQEQPVQQVSGRENDSVARRQHEPFAAVEDPQRPAALAGRDALGHEVQRCRAIVEEIRRCALADPCETDTRWARCGGADLKRALPGTPCENNGERVCALEVATVVECKFGTWKTIRTCRPGACEEIGDEYRCENNTFSEGDECDFADGEFVCASDASSVLACKSGKIFVQHSCGESKKCVQLVEAGQPVITCQTDPDFDAADSDAGSP